MSAFSIVRFRYCGIVFLILSCWLNSGPGAQAAGGIVVTDAADRQVEIVKSAKRVVTTFKPATLFVLGLGGSDILAGVDTPSKSDPLALAIAPGIADLPGVGSKSSGANMETILDLAPDLVILYAHRDGVETAKRLARSGIPAVVIKPETFNSIRETIHLLGAALDLQTRAEAAICAMDGLLETVSLHISDVAASDRKRVYYAAPRGFLTTAPSDMLQDEIIRLAGGINVASGLQGYFKNISTEHLIEWEPDAIVVSGGSRYQAREMTRQRKYTFLPALQTGDVHVFPSSLAPWDYPSPLSALGVLWLGSKLYPQRFRDIALMDEVDAYHTMLFGKRFSRMGGSLDDTLPDTPFPEPQNGPDDALLNKGP